MNHISRRNYLRTPLLFLVQRGRGNIYRKDFLCFWTAAGMEPTPRS